MADQADFTLFFKTIADATGLTALGQNVDSLKERVARAGEAINSALELVGLGVALHQLNEYGNKALEVGQQQAAFAIQIKRSADGSDELVERLNTLNDELERTTGVQDETTRAIQLQLATTRASGDQIASLTKGIIEFAAATGRSGQEVELARLISTRLRVANDEGAESLRRLGIQGKSTDEIIASMARTGGTTAEAISSASGGMDQFRIASDHLRVSLGNFINLIRIPFLTSFNDALEGAKKNIDGTTGSFSKLGAAVYVASAVMGDAVGGLFSRGSLVLQNLYHEAQVVGGGIAQFVLSAVTTVTKGVETLAIGAINALERLATFAADTARTLSGGLIDVKVDTTQAEEGKTKLHDFYQSILDLSAGLSKSVGKESDGALKKIIGTLDTMQARGASGFGKIDEYLAKYETYINRIKNASAGAIPGSGVLPAGADTAGAEKAATDALTNSKYLLAAAEQKFQQEIERTDLLEKTGAITAEEAANRKEAAGAAYIAQIEQLKPRLAELITLFEALGDTKNSDEIKLLLDEIETKILKTQAETSQLDFFSGMRKSFNDFFTSIAPTGQRIGQQLTQSLGTAIQGISSGLGALIFQGRSFGQTMLGVLQSVTSQLIQLGIEIALYYAKKWILMGIDAARAKSHRASDTADHIANETAKQSSTGISAILSSISSWGAAAAVGLAAVLAAVAVLAFAEGGVVPGAPSHKDNTLAWLASGEGVLTTETVQRHGGPGFVHALNSGAFFAQPHYQTGGVVGSAASGVAQSLGGGGSAPVLHVHVWSDPVEAQRMALNDPEGLHVLVDALKGISYMLPTR